MVLAMDRGLWWNIQPMSHPLQIKSANYDFTSNNTQQLHINMSNRCLMLSVIRWNKARFWPYKSFHHLSRIFIISHKRMGKSCASYETNVRIPKEYQSKFPKPLTFDWDWISLIWAWPFYILTSYSTKCQDSSTPYLQCYHARPGKYYKMLRY